MADKRIPTKQFANKLRLKPTYCEVKLHHALLMAFKPYRASVCAQEPIGPFIADFYIAPSNLVIEVDGPSHWKPNQKRLDSRRDSYMQHRNITVMRFTNAEVLHSPQACAQSILNFCMPLQRKDDKIEIRKIKAWVSGEVVHNFWRR
jgi:very-short-patch-repair endonuclease